MNCKKCETGQMVQKSGKNGAFMACDQYPNCKNTENVPEGASKGTMTTWQDTSAKECHLSIEQVRSNALKCAINSMGPAELYETKNVLDLAVAYEAYIMVGK